MPDDAAQDMKSRLRNDLRVAMKQDCGDEAKLLRTLIAALDNAEAPPLPGGSSMIMHHFHDGVAEISRLRLKGVQVQAILMDEVSERERAANDLAQNGRTDRAEALRAEVQLIQRYLA